MSEQTFETVIKKRRGRGPNKPKAPIQVLVVEAADLQAIEAKRRKDEELLLARSQRIFEDSYPFLTVELSIDAGALLGQCTFNRLSVTGRGPSAQRLARDFREWARYQLWQKERADEIVSWYKQDPSREEWLELSSRPITRMDRPEPKKSR